MKPKGLLFLMIILLGLLLRFWRIASNPPALNWDEVSHGYNAYSILKTGRDEWGQRLPLIFRAYGDYKLPLYIYLTVIPVKLLGLTPLAVRLVSILSGVGLVVLAYFFAKKLTRDDRVGLLAAFLTALSPWSLFVSRVALEANLAAFLFALGFLLLWRKQWWGIFFWGLSLHTYNSARVLVPLTLLFLFFSWIREKEKKRPFLTLAIFLVFALPIIFQLKDQSAGARFFWVNPVDQGTVNRIIEKRLSSSLPPLLVRLIYNRPVYFFIYSLKNYLAHFSPSFLFFKGGGHYQFSLPEHGILFPITAPFLAVGLIWLIRQKDWLFLFWFLVAPLPSAITRDSPHVLRSLLVLPLPMVLAALGFWRLWGWFRGRSRFGGKLMLIVFVGGFLVNFGFWWRNYWLIYRPYYSWAWQYGYKEAIDYLQEHYSEYDKIIFTKKYGEPHEFILFYWPWEPSYYQQDPKKVWDYHAHWYWINAFDKFEFWNDWEIKSRLKTQKSKGKAIDKSLKLLLITSPGNLIEGGKRLKTISFLDGEPAFEIIEYNFSI